jgi:hypothetical protein
VEVHDFTECTGPVFPDGFNVEAASPKDYFDLMFNPDMIRNMVCNTNNYARWKMDQKGEEDPLWYEITDNELCAYFGVNIFMGINELPGYKDYLCKDGMPLHLS